MKVRAIVQVDLEVPTLDDADDAIHEVWQEGDPTDRLGAVLWTKDVSPVPEGEQ